MKKLFTVGAILGALLLVTVLVFGSQTPPPPIVLPPGGNCGPVYGCTFSRVTGYCEGTSGACQCMDCYP